MNNIETVYGDSSLKRWHAIGGLESIWLIIEDEGPSPDMTDRLCKAAEKLGGLVGLKAPPLSDIHEARAYLRKALAGIVDTNCVMSDKVAELRKLLTDA
jgi:hypothetical protein